uniref:PH domain-containing protein n=1 Tax=Fundulus heteroclitus TaxID=8078 RepID=A0A3Q2QT58_FUNHE
MLSLHVVLFSRLHFCLRSFYSSLQPDLLNFKKGWMMKLDEDEEWKKYWFVLSTASLRYYKDSLAEESSDLEGEIDLTKCYSVTEYQVQRNYGFQIHTQKAVHTLSAMTAGIRRNWIQALMKNVRPAEAPDVNRLSVVQKEPEGRNDSSENHAAADPSAMQRLSGEVEQLASQNRALNQRNQEMVNQLTEADREIERLKAELGSRYGEPRHPAEAERRGKATLEDVERRLGLRSQELLEAQAQISSLEESLRETEALLQLKDEKGGSEDERKAELLQRLDATEARLTELQRTCRQLEQQNAELKETRERSLQREADVRRPAEEKATGRVPAEEKVQQAIEGATCERGLVAVEDCHLRVVEELQRLHQQEVERLLVERERLLEEESAATATAIEAIKNAHRAELQREVQRRSRSENFKGNAQLEEIHRQEELASFQRELDVLSQQFSLKCLENGHLVQALDAERKALCQCQQENQDLRSRNQVRLLFISPVLHDLFLTITLRVKESEVQCLKQEVASLKEELQAAVKDKRNVTKKYKDVHTELSIIRAKAEQEAEALRENLRLAHQALEESSP